MNTVGRSFDEAFVDRVAANLRVSSEFHTLWQKKLRLVSMSPFHITVVGNSAEDEYGDEETLVRESLRELSHWLPETDGMDDYKAAKVLAEALSAGLLIAHLVDAIASKGKPAKYDKDGNYLFDRPRSGPARPALIPCLWQLGHVYLWCTIMREGKPAKLSVTLRADGGIKADGESGAVLALRRTRLSAETEQQLGLRDGQTNYAYKYTDDAGWAKLMDDPVGFLQGLAKGYMRINDIEDI